MEGCLDIAICQFPVCGDIHKNAARMRAQIAAGAKAGARVIFHPEAALTGYAGCDMDGFDGYDWDALLARTYGLMDCARDHGVYLVFGSAHRLGGGYKPHNCLYAVSPEGKILTRYDKRFCTSGDLKYYSPGGHFAWFEADGVALGLLICYDIRFPELYREYKRLNVDGVLHAFYNARAQTPSTIHSRIMIPSLQAAAASNYLWIAASNASGKYQSWPGTGLRPDGTAAVTLRKNRAGFVLFSIDKNRRLYDAAGSYRDLALNGILSSGDVPDDARSRDLWSV